jgi:Tfp pilus assembly protein FimT
MLPSRAHKSNQGFTLLETATIVVVIGILAAISAPSLLGWYNRTKVDSALNEVRGALQQAQREAMRKSETCTVTFPASGTKNPTIESNCVIIGDGTLDDVTIRHNHSDDDGDGNPELSFNFRGETEMEDAGTIILSVPNNSINYQKCLVTSSGIGLMRTGDYDGATCET